MLVLACRSLAPLPLLHDAPRRRTSGRPSSTRWAPRWPAFLATPVVEAHSRSRSASSRNDLLVQARRGTGLRGEPATRTSHAPPEQEAAHAIGRDASVVETEDNAQFDMIARALAARAREQLAREVRPPRPTTSNGPSEPAVAAAPVAARDRVPVERVRHVQRAAAAVVPRRPRSGHWRRRACRRAQGARVLLARRRPWYKRSSRRPSAQLRHLRRLWREAERA